MSEPFLSEIRLMSFSFPPKGWALCNGQLLPINQNQALFSLIGTTYGGNGQTNFALPDLRGRVPMHEGNGHVIGEKAGEETHTLTANEMPAHLHPLLGTSQSLGGTAVPTGALLGEVADAYGPVQDLTTLAPQSVTSAGGSQPHPNQQPYLALSFCIALQGIFPSQN